MPNTENIQKWVDALRSGKYEQGKDALHPDDKFCCLGVACDISGLGRWEPVLGIQRYVVGDEGDMTLPPLPVADWLGIEQSPKVTQVERVVRLDGEDGDGPYSVELTELNDDLNMSFDQIADYIEQEWL